MKLIVSELEALGRYVSREFYYVMRELIEAYEWEHVETSELWADPRPLKSVLAERFGELPETILFWEGYDLINARARDLLELDCRKCVFADDLHSWDEGMKRRKRTAYLICDTILSAYAYVFDAFFPGLAALRRVVWVPHSASPAFMLAYNEDAENAVLLSGAVNHHYPLREQMKALYDRRAGAVSYHPHPGYQCTFDYERDERVGAGYARLINRHRAAFTDSPKYGYVVAKYFEIPATGALLLADAAAREPLERLGFVEGAHYISISARDMEEKIAYVIDEKNHARIDEIRRAGQKLVWERHKTGDRARLIDETCAREN
jgi:hypothetical protein